MTSLTALAQGAHTAPPAFNADFYMTAATVIPVLFLAVAVQKESAYTTLLEASRRIDTFGARAAANTRAAANGLAGLPLVLGLAVAYMVTVVFVVVILLFATVGEIYALASLYRQHVVGSQAAVLAAAIILTVTAVLGPAIAYVKAAPTRSRRAGCLPLKEPEPSAPAETGKTPD